MTYISWEVDKDMESPPDMITRIRVMNSAQRNMHIIGENISRFLLHIIYIVGLSRVT